MKISPSKEYSSVHIIIFVIAITSLLIWAHPVWAARPSGMAFGSPEDHPSEALYLILTYDGYEPTSGLISALTDLQYKGQLSVIDTHFGEGRILIRMMGINPETLLGLEGVVKLEPIDVPQRQKFDEVASVTGQEITSLTGTGAITGTVTAEDTGLPIPWVSVRIYPADSYNSAGDDYTNIDGIFSIEGLAAGNYKLYFTEGDQYAFEWFNNKLNRESADPLTITDGMTTNISIQLARGGIITGVVKAEDTGLPLGEIDVWACYESGDSYGTDTREDGSYSIGGLAAGSYTICFRD